MVKLTFKNVDVVLADVCIIKGFICLVCELNFFSPVFYLDILITFRWNEDGFEVSEVVIF